MAFRSILPILPISSRGSWRVGCHALLQGILEERMVTHSSILAWRILGVKSLVGYSPEGCKELDMTDLLKYVLEKLFYGKMINLIRLSVI